MKSAAGPDDVVVDVEAGHDHGDVPQGLVDGQQIGVMSRGDGAEVDLERSPVGGISVPSARTIGPVIVPVKRAMEQVQLPLARPCRNRTSGWSSFALRQARTGGSFS